MDSRNWVSAVTASCAALSRQIALRQDIARFGGVHRRRRIPEEIGQHTARAVAIADALQPTSFGHAREDPAVVAAADANVAVTVTVGDGDAPTVGVRVRVGDGDTPTVGGAVCVGVGSRGVAVFVAVAVGSVVAVGDALVGVSSDAAAATASTVGVGTGAGVVRSPPHPANNTTLKAIGRKIELPNFMLIN